jgi:type I restriction enzyme, S subunit
MSDLPAGWTRVAIEDVFDQLSDGRTLHQGWSPRCEKFPSASDEDWGVLKTTAIQPGVFHPEHNKALPPHLSPRPLIEVEAGDLLITCAGPRARCGIACLVTITRPRLMMSGKMYRFRVPNLYIDPRYVALYLQSAEAWAAIDRMKTGGSDSGLNLTHDRFRQLRIPIAPRAEQQRIVAAIEEQVSRLDAGVEALRRTQVRLETLTKAILVAAVPEHAPKGWECPTVADVGTVSLGRQRSPRFHVGPNMRPYLRVANVFEDRIDTSDVMSMHFSDDEFARFRLVDGDVLLNEGQSPHLIGRPAIYRGDPPAVAFTNSLIQFRAGPSVLPEWALLVFRRHLHAKRFMRESQITTNIAHLSAGRFKRIEFPVPPIDEQHRIIREVEEQLDGIKRSQEVIRVQTARASTLWSSVLDAAFSGMLVSQDYDDEPASVLLDRITAERASFNGHKLAKARSQRRRKVTT